MCRHAPGGPAQGRQRHPGQRVRPRCHLAVENLELRDLPSSIVAATSPAGSDHLPNPAVIQQAVQLLYGPDSQTPMSPTPREVRRQTFVARWAGLYTVGPPRFSDRASTIHAYGVSGGSNQFLKGKFQIELFPPADPGAVPTPGNPYANRVTGVAGLIPQNALQSGSLLILDLNGAGPAGSGADALPTHLSWSYDFNNSAAAYSTVGGILPGSGFTQGTGTLDIRYFPDHHPLPGTLGSGRVIVTFQGLINTGGLANVLAKVIS
jgi:hypothetical protein